MALDGGIDAVIDSCGVKPGPSQFGEQWPERTKDSIEIWRKCDGKEMECGCGKEGGGLVSPKGPGKRKVWVGGAWSLPSIICEKHNSSLLLLQLVEGSSQGHKEPLPTTAQMIPIFPM